MTNMKMQEIGSLIRTQDNRATSDPIFIVQRLRRMYGVDAEYACSSVWLDSDQEEASEIEAAGLAVLSANGVAIEGWEKVWYIDHWDFVTACFTEKACQDYIAAHRHNLGESRIYAASAYGNPEWIAVRKFLSEQDD